MIKFETICKTTQGVQIPKNKQYSLPSKGLERYLYITDLLNDSSFKYIENLYPDKLVSEDDLVMANTGSPGKVFKGKKGVLSNNLFKISFEKDTVVKNYLYYVLSSSIFQSSLQEQMKGGIQKHLGHKTISKQLIPLPPLPEQQRIAQILDNAAALRDKTKQLLAEYDTLAHSIFLDMFGDPVTNPKGFEICNLSEFYVSNKGGVKCGPFGGALKKHEFVENGIPVWNMDNITKRGSLVNEIKLWITDEKYKKLHSYQVFNDDIIISRAGTVGKMCVVSTQYEKSIISTNLIRLRLNKSKLLPLFFSLLMNFFKDRVGRLKTGSDGSFTHMNTGVLNNISFPYPPIELQNQFAEKIAVIEQQKDLAQQELQEAENLFNCLLQKAFKGEL